MFGLVQLGSGVVRLLFGPVQRAFGLRQVCPGLLQVGPNTREAFVLLGFGLGDVGEGAGEYERNERKAAARAMGRIGRAWVMAKGWAYSMACARARANTSETSGRMPPKAAARAMGRIGRAWVMAKGWAYSMACARLEMDTDRRRAAAYGLR